MNNITISIEDKDGNPVTYEVDPKLLREYYGQAAYQLQKESDAKDAFKAEVEALSETTKIPKAFLSAFFKKRYKAEIAADSAKVQAFETLEEAFN